VGTEFTLAYVEDKLDEHGLLDSADLREIRPGQSFKAGSLTIHPIQVTHSLVDCVSLAIHTPLGVVISHWRFKVDPRYRQPAFRSSRFLLNTVKKACSPVSGQHQR